jgi:hypothetical protein
MTLARLMVHLFVGGGEGEKSRWATPGDRRPGGQCQANLAPVNPLIFR